jgi:hypothetical protein
MPKTTPIDTTASSMAAKLKGEGPITLTKAEANELRATLRGLFERGAEILKICKSRVSA